MGANELQSGSEPLEFISMELQTAICLVLGRAGNVPEA